MVRQMQEIRRFSDGTIIEQGRGRFDDYCVFLTRPNEGKYAPTDTEYFSFFIEKAERYSSEKIYQDYVEIYDLTTSEIDDEVFDEIERISDTYDEEDRMDFDIWFSVIYLGMVAEEKKAYAVLKKRIKRLGMYQILFEKMSARQAANFSRNKKVAQLSPLCKERGF